MRKARRMSRGALLILSVALLTACGGGEGESTIAPAQQDQASPDTAAPADAAGLPDGSYEHTATVEEAVANGFSRQEASAAFGPDGELPITFVFDGGTWQHIVVDDNGTSEVGDFGTYVIEGNELITTSQSDGCRGCVGTYEYSFDGEVLSLTLATDNPDSEDARDVRLHTEYDFVKVA